MKTAEQVKQTSAYDSDVRGGVELQYRVSKAARKQGLAYVFNKFFHGKQWHTLGVYPSKKCAKHMRKKMCERAGGLWEYRIVKMLDTERYS